MKKIRSYTSIWSVEKVLYSINDFRLPFPITFTQMTCVNVNIKMYKSDKIKMYNYSKLT